MDDLHGFGPLDSDGFRLWAGQADGRFISTYGPIRVREEADGRIRCRVAVGRGQSNISDNIHGGFMLALVDQVPFCAVFLRGRGAPGASVTLSASVNFISAGAIDTDLDAVVEIMAETGRMIFTRGLIEQDGRTVASFEVTLRKSPGRAAQIAGA